MKFGLRELTFFLLLLAIPAGAAFFVFVPRFKQVAELRNSTQEKETRLARLDQLGQASTSLNKELTELKKALDFFESKLPNSQQIDTVLEEVTALRERYKLSSRSFLTQKRVMSADYVAQPIEMKIAGSFEGFYQFLKALEALPRITRIQQMEIRSDGKSTAGQVEVTLVVLIYFEPEGGEKVTDFNPATITSGKSSGSSSSHGGSRW
ncbi:MAG: hypothetical protein BIFFINMI_04002 [Phycisphaerae bacterium]|nr:hypothetical protein [Phycisphaerae bacterium]